MMILRPDRGNIATFPQPDPRLQVTCYVWSPDATRLACEPSGGTEASLRGIYTVRVRDGLDLKRVTSEPGDRPASYSPNGKRIVFGRFIDEQPVGLFTVKVDGSHLRRITPPGLLIGGDRFGDWSPSGNDIVFAARRSGPDIRFSIWVVHADGSGLREMHFTGQPPCGGLRSDPTSRGCFDPTWSPDGKKIAFVVNEPGRTGERIFTSNIDGSDAAPISSADAYYPDWGTHPLGTCSRH
jgi:Tol biopolymer transport system component